jgi:type II secretory pathway predicted ATPase ExeA
MIGLEGRSRRMPVYTHFGLRCAPFETRPDLDFYCPTRAHAEARATLEFAVEARKPCTLLVGASGLGKTLVGRAIERQFQASLPVLWVDGLQPDGPTVAVRRSGAGGVVENETLAVWRRRLTGGDERGVCLIVDDADALTAAGWRTVLETAGPDFACGGVSVILLGGPRLRALLDQPVFERVQQRIFRTAVLTPLSPDEISVYLRARLNSAGGRVDEILTPEAIAMLARLSGGIPARLNRLADNTLLEAIAAGRASVLVADVHAAVTAIRGIDVSPTASPDAVPAGPEMSRRAKEPASAPFPRTRQPVADAPRPRVQPRPAAVAAPRPAEAVGVADAVPAAAPPVRAKLAGMEQRLSHVLSALRAARGEVGAPAVGSRPAPTRAGAPGTAAATPAEPSVTPIVWKRVGPPGRGRA